MAKVIVWLQCHVSVRNYIRNEWDVILTARPENVTGSEYMKARAPSWIKINFSLLYILACWLRDIIKAQFN